MKIPSGYEFIKTVQEGNFTNTCVVKKTWGSEFYFLKQATSKETSKYIFRELRTLLKIKKRGKFLQHFVFPTKFSLNSDFDLPYIVFPFIKKSYPYITNSFIHTFFSILGFLHSINIFHRDIKSDNILFSGKSFFLIDFGNSTNSDWYSHAYTSGHSPYQYSTAPQIDIYASCVFIFYSLHGQIPFKSRQQYTLFKESQKKFFSTYKTPPKIKNILSYVFLNIPSDINQVLYLSK